MATEEDLTDFGIRLRDLRKGAGMTQQYIADQLNVSQTAVGQWENGQHEPSRGRVFELEQLFGCLPGWLSSALGYQPPTNEELTLSASGVDLEELRRVDPDA